MYLKHSIERSAPVILNAVRSTSFKITVVAIVRVLLVIEKRVRSTSFSITSIGRVHATFGN